LYFIATVVESTARSSKLITKAKFTHDDLEEKNASALDFARIGL